MFDRYFILQRLKMNINKLGQLFWVILAGSMLGACSHTDPQANAGKPPAPKVKLATVETASVSSSAEFIASLQSRRSVTLLPQIVGHVTKISAKYGDSVAAGTELIEIDPAQQQATVSSNIAASQVAESDLESAKATLSQLEAQQGVNESSVNYNKKQYKRYVDLSNEGAVPVQNRDQFADSLRQAQANLAAIKQQIQAQRSTVAQKQNALKQAKANIQQQQVQLGYYKITAPFSGIVGDIPVKIGDYVTASTTLTTVTQNQPLEVNVSVPIEDASKLRLGMTVEVLNQQGQSVGPSRIFFIAPSTDNNTQSVVVKSLFDNSNNQLRANQYARARVIWDQHPGVLIPTTAVSRIAGQTFVFVAQTQQPSGQAQAGKPQILAKQKPVKLGDIEGNNYQVLSGLQPGERLVVSGILNLSDGVPISPES